MKPHVVIFKMDFERTPAYDGTTETMEIQTSYTSRTDMFKFGLLRLCSSLGKFLPRRKRR